MRARYPFLIRSYTIYIRQDKTPDGCPHSDNRNDIV
nr:MAG TPA: hypothetical protein [Caudoviricetes sp.]